MVVVWTKTSVKSSWVKNEARKGLRRKRLFPVMLLDEVEIPLEFGHVQAAQLIDWQPEVTHFGFDQFVQDIAQEILLHLALVFNNPGKNHLLTKPASGIESPSDRAGQVKTRR